VIGDEVISGSVGNQVSPDNQFQVGQIDNGTKQDIDHTALQAQA
jgi:hypothetical protein